MTVAPEQVRNVWAGDAVSFSTPVADLRHPSGWLTGPLLVCSAGSFVIAFTIGSERSFVLPGIVLGLVVVIAEGAAVINRVRARRRAAQRVVKNLGDLAERGWTLPLVRGRRAARFDAREWIDRTGPHGPRLLLREVRLPAIPADPGVTEEDVLATHVERRPLPRKITWFLFAGAVCLSAVGLINRGPVSVFSLGPLAMALVAIAHLNALGIISTGFFLPSASPGRISRPAVFRGTHVFARDDSVLILEPLGTSAVVRGQVVRRDGRSHGFRFSLGVNDPVLAALLSRWCWRDGAGVGNENHPLRDEDLLPSLPASE